MPRRKVSTTVYITPEQDERLKELSGRTKVPVAEYVRQGIALIVETHRDLIELQAELPHLAPPRPPRPPAPPTPAETAQGSLFDTPPPPRRRR